MALDIQIGDLLRSNEVKEMNFSFRGLRITGYGYWELSHCFSDRPVRHRIRVSVRPELVGSCCEAEYLSDDKLLLRSRDVMATDIGRSVVVHECTHAQFDLRSRGSSERSEESACFIAEAWYLLARRVDRVIIDSRVSPEIRTIAEDLRSRAQRLYGAPAELTLEQMSTARSRMAREGYSNERYIRDGIRGYRYRGD